MPGQTIQPIYPASPGHTAMLGLLWCVFLPLIPIGGREAHNTMNEEEALKVVRMMHPKLVIPCHYNCPVLFSKKYNPADDTMFKKEVEKTGAHCVILHENESVQR